MAAPTGHQTDRPKLFLQPGREQLKRVRLQRELAAIPHYFRHADLLTDAERQDIRAKVRRAVVARRLCFPASSPQGGRYIDAPKPPPGISLVHRASTDRAGESPMPRYLRRRQLSQGGSMSDFDYWRREGANARIFGRRVSDMSRDELLAALGWLLRSRDVWRELVVAERSAQLHAKRKQGAA